MPLPGSKRQKAMAKQEPKFIQEIVETEPVETEPEIISEPQFIQEINEPEHQTTPLEEFVQGKPVEDVEETSHEEKVKQGWFGRTFFKNGTWFKDGGRF